MKYFKTIVIFFGTLIFCYGNAYSQSDYLEASARFFNAGSAYKNEDYAGAIKEYEEILQNGLMSGELYFNLGNSYLKKGNLGKAILNYERARLLIPRDSDLESNYYYARSLINGYQVDPEQTFLYRFIHGYSNRLSFDELTITSFLLCLLTGIIYLAGIFFKWPLRIFAVTIIVSCFLFAYHVFLLIDKIYYQKNIAVVLVKTDSKFEPIDRATTHFKLPEGTKIQILKEKGKWLKVQRLDGKAGWSKKDRLEKIRGR